MKFYLWIMLFATISFNCFAEENNSHYSVCNQPYALCTTAPCTPIPGLPNVSVCRCVVENGPSLGQLSCEQRKPSVSRQGQHVLTSNFSFKDAAINKVMTCTGNHPWTNCLDKPCIIDPQNSNQAICSCEIKRTEKFITFGGSCNTASCSTTLYSGASLEMYKEANTTLLKAMHLTTSPMQNCPK